GIAQGRVLTGSTLESLDARLHAHFGTLALLKGEAGHPVFALEHGVEPIELEELRRALAEHVQVQLTSRFWLSWVVHAAEHGYTFEGLEFWRSFAAKTPAWDNYNGVRDLLRSWFVKFKATFRGARPNGRWAANYRYIAWPITHALLPSDLQFRLAESMYQMRFRLGATSALTPANVGNLVAAHTHHGSDRYWNFLAQKELVGRIVLGLLHSDPDDQDAIYPPTLRRIIQDFNRTVVAREMLEDTRRHYEYARYRVHGSSGLPGPFSLVPPGEDDPDGESPEIETVLVRSNVILERDGTGRWAASLQLPSFQALSNRHGDFARHLAQCMVSIPCHGDAWFPARVLVTGRRERSLQR